MTHRPVPAVELLLARLTVAEGDVYSALEAALQTEPADVGVLCVAALLRTRAGYLQQASNLAATRRDRQRIAVVRCLGEGDGDQGLLLAREHLAEFPEDLVVAWAVARVGR